MPIEALHRIQITQGTSGVDIRSTVRYANGFEENHPRLSYSSLDRARKGTIVRTLAWMAIEKINRGIEVGGAILLGLDIGNAAMYNKPDLNHALVGLGAAAFTYISGYTKSDAGEEAIRNSQLVQSIEEIRGSHLSTLDQRKPYVLD